MLPQENINAKVSNKDITAVEASGISIAALGTIALLYIFVDNYYKNKKIINNATKPDGQIDTQEITPEEKANFAKMYSDTLDMIEDNLRWAKPAGGELEKSIKDVNRVLLEKVQAEIEDEKDILNESDITNLNEKITTVNKLLDDDSPSVVFGQDPLERIDFAEFEKNLRGFLDKNFPDDAIDRLESEFRSELDETSDKEFKSFGERIESDIDSVKSSGDIKSAVEEFRESLTSFQKDLLSRASTPRININQNSIKTQLKMFDEKLASINTLNDKFKLLKKLGIENADEVDQFLDGEITFKLGNTGQYLSENKAGKLSLSSSDEGKIVSNIENVDLDDLLEDLT